MAVHLQTSAARTLVDRVLSNLKIEPALSLRAETKPFQRITLDEALRLSVSRKPGCPDLHRHSRRIAGTAVAPRIGQEIAEPPCAASIGEAEPDEPDLVTASSRESGKDFIESLHDCDSSRYHESSVASRFPYAPTGIESFSASVVGLGRSTGVAAEGAVGSGITVVGAVDLGTLAARLNLGPTLFFRGPWIPAASRSSASLNCRNFSRRARSGAACTSPENPKYIVPL